MGNLKDELSKMFPDARERLEQAKADAKTRRNSLSKTDEWKVGVRPLKKGESRAPDASNGTQRRRNNSLGIQGQSQSQRKDTNTSSSNLIKEVADYNSRLDAFYGKSKKDRNPSRTPPQNPRPPVVSYNPVAQASIARIAEYKEPDYWVNQGASLQPNSNQGGRNLDVRIGIDFGTAYTKVAVSLAQKVFFVDWDGVRLSAQRYLLPGELSIGESGTVWLGRKSKSVEVLNNLKLPFLSGRDATPHDSAKTVVFLAWVMRYARAWLYYQHPAILENRRLSWEVNLGIPTNSWSSTHLEPAYNHIGRCAWLLSQMQGNLGIDSAQSILCAVPADLQSIGLNDLQFMPEFVAQIAGYVRSPQRQDGLHLLIDIGAGTLDIASFNVFRESMYTDQYPIFASTVELLGTHYFMGNRMYNLGLNNIQWDDLNGTPSAADFCASYSICPDKLKSVDDSFEYEISKSIGKILKYTKDHRYPKAPEWQTGLRVFMAGGGSECDVYRHGLNRVSGAMRVPYRFSQIPLSEDALTSRLDAGHFHRLSVAYGLTFNAESIGNILRPHEIPDVEALASHNNRSDRDELYPK